MSSEKNHSTNGGKEKPPKKRIDVTTVGDDITRLNRSPIAIELPYQEHTGDVIFTGRSRTRNFWSLWQRSVMTAMANKRTRRTKIGLGNDVVEEWKGRCGPEIEVIIEEIPRASWGRGNQS